ncbi:orotidine-5'-phosphate decarboxylase [Halobacillus sp. A1]|nr:orotidine-5'-phosphate decarboxylase [Halobacillus sp. A1]
MNQLEEIYVALDFESKMQTISFLDEHELDGVPVKVGMELFYKEGPAMILELKKRNHPLFLDLKSHDIPATVKRAMRSISSLGVDVVNVHAAGGSRMIEAAKEGLAQESSCDTKLLAVTQLTSTDQDTLKSELLIDRPLNDVVTEYSKLSKRSGADGVVCSVKEVEAIKKACGREFLALTPGIRQAEDDRHDQKRIATPFDAGFQGSDSIVVGRSITQSKNPRDTYEQFKEAFSNGKQQN